MRHHARTPLRGRASCRPRRCLLRHHVGARGREQLVTAPIPGTITLVSVSVGQSVQRGDGLVTIEAMKMLNVIRSAWAGTITAVHVDVGKHVAQGELLMSVALT